MDNKYLCRGKKISTGEWVYGNIIEKKNGIKVIVNDFTGDMYAVSRFTVGRCTGLSATKSYRGESEEDMLIFECDILKHEAFGSPVIGEVVWTDMRHTGFMLKITKGDEIHFYSIGRGQYNDDESDTCNVEIIGYIHDAPELLEG